MKSKLLGLLLVGLLGVAVYVGNVMATPATGLTTTILAKSTVGDLNLTGRALGGGAAAAPVLASPALPAAVGATALTTTATTTAAGRNRT